MPMPPATGLAIRERGGLLSYLSLFTSFGTLLCCALPSLLVLIGLGATVASVLSAAPWLVAISRHKNLVFLFSGLLIAANFLLTYALVPKLRGNNSACSVEAPDACQDASRLGRAVLWGSLVIYTIGLLSAYALGPILMRFAD